MLFHARRSFRLKNLLINRDIICSKETRYKINKKPSNNLYIMRKCKVKQKRKIF